MMKHDKQLIKKWKNEKNDKKMKKNSRNIVIFHFLEIFAPLEAKNDETW